MQRPISHTVGPCGRWDIVRPVGVPRCSCNRQMSVRPAPFAELTRSGKMRFPRLRRIAVGSINLISFAKAARRLEGSLDVVTRTRGSTMPDRALYSSSRSSSSLRLRSARDSSYWKSFRSPLSLAMVGSRGRPDARLSLSFALFSLTSASLRSSAFRYR